MDIKQLVTYKTKGGIISEYDCSTHSAKLICNCLSDVYIGEMPYESGDNNNPYLNNNFNPIDDIIKHLIEIKSDILEEVKVITNRDAFNNRGEPILTTKLGFKQSKKIVNNVIDHRRDVSIHTDLMLCNTGLDFASHLDVIEYAKTKPGEFTIIDIASDEQINFYQSIWNNSEHANLVILVTKKQDLQPQQIS